MKMITKENYRRMLQDTTPNPPCLVSGVSSRGLTAIADSTAAGKDAIAINLVAAVSTGRDSTLTPVGLRGAGDALLCVLEDSTVSVMARLRQQGANLDRVYLADCTDVPRLDTLVDCLADQMKRTHLDLIVIDDIDVLMVDCANPTGYDWQCLYRLDDLARQAGCAIVIVCRVDVA